MRFSRWIYLYAVPNQRMTRSNDMFTASGSIFFLVCGESKVAIVVVKSQIRQNIVYTCP